MFLCSEFRVNNRRIRKLLQVSVNNATARFTDLHLKATRRVLWEDDETGKRNIAVLPKERSRRSFLLLLKQLHRSSLFDSLLSGETQQDLQKVRQKSDNGICWFMHFVCHSYRIKILYSKAGKCHKILMFLFGLCPNRFLSLKVLSTDLIRIFMMNVSKTVETEEDLLTCLHIKLYHPQQSCRPLYSLLPVGTRSRHSADDPLRLGRDDQACSYALVDSRVSRKQLALHAYRSTSRSDMLFTIQNLSQRGRLSVNSSALDYLERMDLPDKALIRFGEYELLIIRESGEAKASFEVEFEVLAVPPSRETCSCVPSMTPVAETGSSTMNGFPCEVRALGPLETDETLMLLTMNH